jgi:RNase P subunit RPR2
MEIRFCPRCKSKQVKLFNSRLGNPLVEEGMTGYECSSCGFVGQFPTASKKDYEKIKKG